MAQSLRLLDREQSLLRIDARHADERARLTKERDAAVARAEAAEACMHEAHDLIDAGGRQRAKNVLAMHLLGAPAPAPAKPQGETGGKTSAREAVHEEHGETFERLAFDEGRERGLEEAARVCEAYAAELGTKWNYKEHDTINECAQRIRALASGGGK